MSKVIYYSSTASLIKTIIGGAQIIDLMILVVDITKGVQTQTAECLVIGEITCSRMIVVINKIDSVAADKREKTIEKVFVVSYLRRNYGTYWLIEVELPYPKYYLTNASKILDDKKNESNFIFD